MTNKENPPELVQHFAYGGSSHRRKGAAIIQYSLVISLPLSEWQIRGYFTCSNEDYLPSRRLE
jgi:hypothetical protein